MFYLFKLELGKFKKIIIKIKLVISLVITQKLLNYNK